ncbi:hypothetical protein D3C72_1706070 [compost metagenome]
MALRALGNFRLLVQNRRSCSVVSFQIVLIAESFQLVIHGNYAVLLVLSPQGIMIMIMFMLVVFLFLQIIVQIIPADAYSPVSTQFVIAVRAIFLRADFLVPYDLRMTPRTNGCLHIDILLCQFIIR